MPNLYARATALPNVVGRVDYISSPNRQERLLAVHDGTADLLDGQFWRQLAQESQAAFDQFGNKTRMVKDRKTGEMVERELKCCQGRELMIMLSNSLLQRMTPEEIAKIVVDEVKEKLGLDVIAAVHLKHFADGKDNLHVHVILPERQLLKEPVIKTAERNLFFDETGKRRYKKSEILDENKQLRAGCRIVKKGEVYERRFFGSVDEKYSSKAWMKDVKTNVVLPLRNGKLKGDVEITEFDPSTGKLPQQHIGNYVTNMKSQEAKDMVARIEAYNRDVRAYNAMVDEGKISTQDALIIQKKVEEALKKNGVLHGSLVMQQLKYDKKLKEDRARFEQERTLDALKKQFERVTDAQEDHLQGHVIKAKKDWVVQRKIDTINAARELGVGSVAEIEQKKQELGRELGRTKRAYEAALRQYGSNSPELREAEESMQAAKKRFAAIARMETESNRARIEADVKAIKALQQTQHENGSLDDLIGQAEATRQQNHPRRTWDGADENDGGFSGER